MRAVLLAMVLSVAACDDDAMSGQDASVDLQWPTCESINPPESHPMGRCTIGAICKHKPPEGWTCTCDSNLMWSCTYVGQSPDM